MIKWWCKARDSQAAGLETSLSTPRLHSFLVLSHFVSLDSPSIVPTALFGCFKSSWIVASSLSPRYMHHKLTSFMTPVRLGHRPVYRGLVPQHRSPFLFRISDVLRDSSTSLLISFVHLHFGRASRSSLFIRLTSDVSYLPARFRCFLYLAITGLNVYKYLWIIQGEPAKNRLLTLFSNVYCLPQAFLDDLFQSRLHSDSAPSCSSRPLLRTLTSTSRRLGLLSVGVESVILRVLCEWCHLYWICASSD